MTPDDSLRAAERAYKATGSPEAAAEWIRLLTRLGEPLRDAHMEVYGIHAKTTILVRPPRPAWWDRRRGAVTHLVKIPEVEQIQSWPYDPHPSQGLVGPPYRNMPRDNISTLCGSEENNWGRVDDNGMIHMDGVFKFGVRSKVTCRKCFKLKAPTQDQLAKHFAFTPISCHLGEHDFKKANMFDISRCSRCLRPEHDYVFLSTPREVPKITILQDPTEPFAFTFKKPPSG